MSIVFYFFLIYINADYLYVYIRIFFLYNQVHMPVGISINTYIQIN